MSVLGKPSFYFWLDIYNRSALCCGRSLPLEELQVTRFSKAESHGFYQDWTEAEENSHVHMGEISTQSQGNQTHNSLLVPGVYEL